MQAVKRASGMGQQRRKWALAAPSSKIAQISLQLLQIVLTVQTTHALYPYKLLNDPNQLIPLQPDEWTAEYACERPNELLNNASLPYECQREPTAWRFNYVRELEGPFKVLVREGSLDERMANIIYSATSNTGLDLHAYKFNSGSRERDLQNERLVAGPQANNAKCLEHLRQMTTLLEEIHQKVASARLINADTRNANVALNLNEAHFRLARALDAYGKFESGSLSGRYHAMGVYAQCLSTPMQLKQADSNTRELVPTRYCWARMALDKHLSKPLERRQRFEAEGDNFQMLVAACLPQTCHSQSFNREQPGNAALAAETSALLQRLIASQFQLPEMFLERQLDLDAVFCLVDEQSEWARFPLAGKLFLAAASCWLALVLFATIYRRRKHVLDSPGSPPPPPQLQWLLSSGEEGQVEAGGRLERVEATKRRSFLNNLDLFESWLEFIGERDVQRRAPVELDVLNPLKVVASFGIIMAHAGIIVGPLSREGLAAVAASDNSRIEMLLLSGFVLVDTFFVMSGILLTYITLTKLARRQRPRRAAEAQPNRESPPASKPAKLTTSIVAMEMARGDENGGSRGEAEEAKRTRRPKWPAGADFCATWLGITLYRYLRIVPLFFVVFAFKKTVYNHLGSGPLWDWALNKDTPSGGCLQETWLTPFTFVSAYLPLARQCLPPTWSLSNDLFFSLVVPPLIILYLKRPQLAKWLTGALILLGSLLSLQAYYSIKPLYRYELEQIRFHGVMMLFSVASQMYTIPTYRITAMLVGVVAGYALFKYEQRAIAPAAPPRSTGVVVHLMNNKAPLATGQPQRPPMVAQQEAEMGNGQSEPVKVHFWPWWFRRVASPMGAFYIVLSSVTSLMTVELRDALGPKRAGYLVPVMLIGYHITWSLANAAIFLRMLTDWKDSFVLRMFSGRFFRVFAKLTFALLLVHWDLLMFASSTQTFQLTFTRATYFSRLTMAYFWALPLSIFLYVAVENPLDKLSKTYLLKA